MRQSGLSLAAALGRGCGPVEFVVSMRLPEPPSAEPVLRRLELYPDYRLVAEGLPYAWLEDPALTAETRRVLGPHMGRITWDAPIGSVEARAALAVRPQFVNVKPSRFGTLRGVLDAYDYLAAQGIRAYGGGQFELGPGRGQIQYLASLSHPDAPNDVAPLGFHEIAAGLPHNPLTPAPAAVRFRWSD